MMKWRQYLFVRSRKKIWEKAKKKRTQKDMEKILCVDIGVEVLHISENIPPIIPTDETVHVGFRSSNGWSGMNSGHDIVETLRGLVKIALSQQCEYRKIGIPKWNE